MYLVSAGLQSDEIQQDIVEIVKSSTNAFLSECFDDQLDLASIVKIALAKYSGKIVFVSHGRTNLLCGGSKRLPYLGFENISAISNCQVLAFACYSAQSLGKVAVDYAFCYAGFDAPVAVPSVDSEFLHHYRTLLSLLFATFHNLPEGIVEPTLIEELFAQLLCNIEAVKLIFELPDGTTLTALDLICLKNLQNDMCVWLKGMESPIKHKEAPPLALLWN